MTTPPQKQVAGQDAPMSEEEVALQALRDKCAGALQEFKETGGGIATFEVALGKRGVRLRLSFADDYSRISGTSYVDGERSFPGSSVGKEFGAKAVMELTGYQRLRDWPFVQHHLPLMERLRSLPTAALVQAIEHKGAPSAPLPDPMTLAGVSLHSHFVRAGLIFAALQSKSVSRADVSSWIESLRHDAATKPLADSVALFLNGFGLAASLRERGVRMEDHLASIEQKSGNGGALSTMEEIALLHPGAMVLCEKFLSGGLRL